MDAVSTPNLESLARCLTTKEENLVFKKVVRDKIPESIADKGELVTQVKIKGAELVEALKTKLIEEAIEVMDAKSTGETIEELADVLEVLHALSHHLKRLCHS